MPKSFRILLMMPMMLLFASGAEAQVAGCTERENQVIAQYVPKMIQAMMVGRMDIFKALADESNAMLSQQCHAAMARQQQQQLIMQQQQQRRTPSSGGGGVIDHGGGAYSAPGAYCGPGGCIPTR